MAKLPMTSPKITQEYGRKGNYRKGYHTGIDLVATTPNKSICSVGQGEVIRVGSDPKGWGSYVIVRQNDGHDVLYAHLSIVSVKEDQRIAPGEKLGVQGNTGNSTGPHLHLEIWKGDWINRNEINPAVYLNIENKVGPIKQKEAASIMSKQPSTWAKSVWEWGVKEGITDGSNPQKTATREEVVSMLHKALVMKKDA